MSELVFVGDENHSIIDDWMVGSKSSVDSSYDPSKAIDAKSGLGFQGDIKKTVKVDDKFAQAMNKNKKNKNKRERDQLDSNEQYEATHGVVEDMEESRTSISLNRGFVKKSVLKAEKKKQQAEELAAANAAKEKEAAASTATAAVTPVVADTTPSDSNRSDIKLKRTKTRSKQKNIRRDNRGDDVKPAHLKIGAKDYTGRPLTQETKKLLGIAKKQPPAPRQQQSNNNKQQNAKDANANSNKGSVPKGTGNSNQVANEKPVINQSHEQPKKKAKAGN